jgi:peptidylprolyl isomerase
VVSPSGLASKMLARGTGPRPGPTSKVKVHYTGWTIDGKMFDSSVVRGGEPPLFPVNALIKGFSEALQLMTVGETRRVWIPADLAYGKTPRAGAPAGTLVFDIALLEIVTP